MSETKKIHVLIIDDSLFMRQMISDIFQSDPEITVVGTAATGKEGITKIHRLKPDVVTLDYEMPGLNGIATLKKIMHEHPIPVIMISAHTKKGGEVTLEALSNGAVDYVLKPSRDTLFDITLIQSEIVTKVKTAARIHITTLTEFFKKNAQKLVLPQPQKIGSRIVAVGSSTGGIKGVELILESLPAGFPAPVLIVQHMPALFTTLFADRLNRLSKLTVKESEHGEEVTAGVAYIAPGGWHMKIQDQHSHITIQHSTEPPIYGLRPSIDVLFTSIAQAYGAHAIGIILSGMGTDGTDGLNAIYTSGGKTIAQNETTSVVFGMPKSVIEDGVVDDVLPIEMIAPRIIELLQEENGKV